MSPRFLPQRQRLPGTCGLGVPVSPLLFWRPLLHRKGRCAQAGVPLQYNRGMGGGSRSWLATETSPILCPRRLSVRTSAGTLLPSDPYRQCAIRATASGSLRLRRAIGSDSRHDHGLRGFPRFACLPSLRWIASLDRRLCYPPRDGARGRPLCAIQSPWSSHARFRLLRIERHHSAVVRSRRRCRT